MLLCHHDEDVARTSDTSTLSEQFSLPAWEREQVEAKGHGSFMGLHSAFVRAGSALAVWAPSLVFPASRFVSASVNRG